MYLTVNLAWVIFAVGVCLTALCSWKFPRTAVPITIGIATATALAIIMHL
jgi:hypothetical protein